MKTFSFLLALPFLFLCNTAFAETDWKITDFRSDIIIQSDGLIHVKEVIGVLFDMQKHGIYRDLPLTYRAKDGSELKEDIDIISVTGVASPWPYETTNNGANLRLQIGDPFRMITGPQTYTIEYTVSGALRPFETYDELYWNVTGNGWDVPVEKSEATITLPQDGIVQMSCYYGPAGATTQCDTNKITEKIAQFTYIGALPPRNGMTISLGYTKGMVPMIEPIKTKDPFSRTRALLSFAGTFLLSLIFPIILWWKKGRDMKTENRSVSPLDHETIIAEYESPLGLRPGELGVLVDENADTLDITATIVDLAIRGFLTIEEIPKKWVLGSSDYRLTKTEKNGDALLDYENKLLTALFKKRTAANFGDILKMVSGLKEEDEKTTEEKINISDLRNTFYTDLAEIKKSLYADVTDKKLFDEDPFSLRLKYGGFATLVIISGITILAFFGSARDIYLGAGIGILVSGIVFMIIARRGMPRRTAAGHDAYLKALGYKLFVSGTEKYRAPFFENQNIFIEVLPFAIVFGVTKKLSEAMKEMGINPPAPAWYTGSQTFNAAMFASNMGDISNALSTALASAPSGSGSGGGGFSGGGGGGGGGGSW